MSDKRTTLYRGYAFKADKAAYFAAYNPAFPAYVQPWQIPSVYWETVIIDDLTGNDLGTVVIDDCKMAVIEVKGEFYAAKIWSEYV